MLRRLKPTKPVKIKMTDSTIFGIVSSYSEIIGPVTKNLNPKMAVKTVLL